MTTDQLRYQALQLATSVGLQAAAQGATGLPEEASITIARAEVYYGFLAQGLPTPPAEE